MKRLWAAAAMALIIAAIIISGVTYINKYTRSVDNMLSEAYRSADSGDFKKAAALCRSAEKEWVRAERTLRWFVNTGELSEIGLSVASLAPYADKAEAAELLSQINITRVRLIHMSKMEAMAE